MIGSILVLLGIFIILGVFLFIVSPFPLLTMPFVVLIDVFTLSPPQAEHPRSGTFIAAGTASLVIPFRWMTTNAEDSTPAQREEHAQAQLPDLPRKYDSATTR